MVNPVAFSIGSLSVRWYGILLVIGDLFWIYIFLKLRECKGISEKDGWDYVFWMSIGILIGARLFHVFVYSWDYFSTHLIEIFYLWTGGISSHGGIIGAVVATFIFSKVVTRSISSLKIWLIRFLFEKRSIIDFGIISTK